MEGILDELLWFHARWEKMTPGLCFNYKNMSEYIQMRISRYHNSLFLVVTGT